LLSGAPGRRRKKVAPEGLLRVVEQRLHGGGGAVVLLDVLVVLVGVSCAYPAAAGRNDAVTNAPTITARARGMTVYRPEEPDC